MAKSSPCQPGWTIDIRSMLAAFDDPQYKHIVRVRCDKCGKDRDFTKRDLERIADQRGEAFKLWNKRTRCRLTTGCSGWNTFSYSNGTWVYRLYDEAQLDRWQAHDAERERIGRRILADAVRGHKHVMAAKKARERR